ncbi:GH15 family glucan-1,4-alpha-glucosidase [Halopolyspora algeriensis]|uniref:GH15 family glucan-1,4-alpha-glucosidase n=1 Tax=Halopolyspora algeriensis TaxID=1500506 RepID=A0A368VZJ1_9ACTN|nr:glycoside hydrolase family 15 protein [Halopolyspora algeriensis]RCW46262.1 GH15 family glucan-1,4-alpha-glucosidase [Halopolyspora algeriensis]TQM55664.1 GH15 family glucan-1,4-alpha-glucosidase [Halopolyspora algeriensis]
MADVPDFRPEVLREYALLADGERGALIGPRGDITWMCAPRWDSDAVFSSLIGGAGAYAVSPSDPWYVWGGYYEQGTLIWHSRWMTSSGAIECREALAFPGDPHTAVVLRRVQALDGPAEVRVLLDPQGGFGRHSLRKLSVDDGVWTGRVGPLYLRWSGAEEARQDGDALAFTLTVPHGSFHDLVLELSDRPLPSGPAEAAPTWEATENRWRRSVPDMGATLGKRDAHHAYAVLRGLTSASGGMVGAVTTSLPERAEAGRNYDYRYTWIRDQCYAAQAVAADGPHPLLDNAVGFIAERLLADGPSLHPAYTVEGGRVPETYTLPRVRGYPGGGNRAGNKVTDQFQLDAFGEALLLFAAAARHDRLDTEHWRAVEVAVAAIEQRRGEPDAGVWELAPDRWAHSRLICAAGLRAVARSGAATAQAASWTSLADAIVAETTRDCLHPSGRWQRSPNDPGVDAALLLCAVRGAIPADDPRSLATLGAVRDGLTQDGYVYRFRHDQRPLYEAEGAFLLCGFITALATHQQGWETEARAWFERNRAACGPAGLYSEEYDVNQRQLRGNIPQAFVHALMLEAASRLARPWEHL